MYVPDLVVHICDLSEIERGVIDYQACHNSLNGDKKAHVSEPREVLLKVAIKLDVDVRELRDASRHFDASCGSRGRVEFNQIEFAEGLSTARLLEVYFELSAIKMQL